MPANAGPRLDGSAKQGVDGRDIGERSGAVLRAAMPGHDDVERICRMSNDWNRYGPTAARPQGKPGRTLRPQSLTVDLHSHVAVPRAAELVKPHLDFSTIPLARYATPDTKAIN